MTAKLIEVKPHQDNVGGSGECARWSSPPTPEQAAQYASNEWAVGQTHAPDGDWDESDSGTGKGASGGVWWGVALLLVIALLCAAVVLPPILIWRHP